jgi:hypothetical protein
MAQFSNDQNRDGMDDDIDRRPGSERQSASLARMEDPRSEQEYSNQLSPQNLLQERFDDMRVAESRRKAREAMQAAQQDVHYFPDVGKFIIPAENTWAAHADLVLNNEMRLHFNPDKYFFDRIIDDKLHIPALADRNHPDFDKYRGLRTNLEVLRNDIIGMYLDDGGFDRGDEVFIEPIKGIAETIGNALSNDVWWKRPFVNHLSMDVANVEAVGAAEMYKFLLKEQENSRSAFAGFKDGLRELAGLPKRNWGLLPLERSPFSPEALSAPRPKIERMVEATVSDMSREMAEHRAMESLALINATNRQMKPLDSLSKNDKAISVEDGRTIIRWLRNLQGVDMDVQDFLSAGTPPEQIAKAEALSTLVQLYSVQMQNSPHMHHLPDVKEGSDAAGGAAMMIGEHAMTLLPENNPAYALLASAIDGMPESHFERSHQSVSRLVDYMEKGLSQISGRKLDERTAVDRLLQAGDRIHQQAMQLRSVDSLDIPEREESVELAREILRKLRGMMFENKPIEETIDTGKPEEKATLAEKLEELVEIYRNLLSDALIVNPGLADDPRIKAANDAVGGMTHGIKLMAAKEIPSSAAQTQQIGADITRMPEEWKKLDGHTVDRLMDSVEGGLEAAVESMDAQEQQQQKDAELAQEILESSVMHADNGRRKRRSRRKQRSGISRSEKTKLDLIADDRAAGQGIYAQQAERKGESKEVNSSSAPSSAAAPPPAPPPSERPARREARLDAQEARNAARPNGQRDTRSNSRNVAAAFRPSSGSRNTAATAVAPAQEKPKTQTAYKDFNDMDIAAIKSLGQTLKGAGNQAKSLPAVDVGVDTHVAPNDKSAAERAIDSIKSRKNNSQIQ